MSTPQLLPPPKPGERGIAVMLSALLMTFTIGTVGLGIDGGRAYIVKSRLSNAADSAARAAARALQNGNTQAEANTNAANAAQAVFRANFPDNFLGTDPAQTTLNSTITNLSSGATPQGVVRVTINVSSAMSSMFLNMFNVGQINLNASGSASRRTLVMVMAVNNWGWGTPRPGLGTVPTSTGGSFGMLASPCDALVYHISRMKNFFTPYDTVGLVTFTDQAVLAYPPSSSFKETGAAGMDNVLKNVDCPSSGSNTAPAINLAWDAIRNVGIPGAINEIMVYSQIPNVVSGTMPIRFLRDDRYGKIMPYPKDADGVTIPPDDTPANANLLWRVYDMDSPFSPSAYSRTDPLPGDPPLFTPTLDPPYTAAQSAQLALGVPARYGDYRLLPLTAAQFAKYKSFTVDQRNRFGWYLPSESGPYKARWKPLTWSEVMSYGLPYIGLNRAMHYIRCTEQGIAAWNANCYQAPLPSLASSPATMRVMQRADNNMWWGSGRTPAFSFGPTLSSPGATPPPTGFQDTTYVPPGYPDYTTNFDDYAYSQTIAHWPDLDAMGNSNYGPKDNFGASNGIWSCGDQNQFPTAFRAGGALEDWFIFYGCKYMTRNNGWTTGNNPTGYPGRPYAGKLRPDLPETVFLAGMNSLISAANRVRSDTTYSIRIDSIYNPGYYNFADRDFLQLVANRRTIMRSIYEGSGSGTANSSFNANRPEGMYRESPVGLDYQVGMAEIANDLVRLCLIS